MITFGDLEINDKIYVIVPESFDENDLSVYKITDIKYSKYKITFEVGSPGSVIVIPKSYENRSFYKEKDFVDIIFSDIRLFEVMKQSNKIFPN